MLEITIAIQTFLMGVYILFFDNLLYENFQIGKMLDNKLWGAVLVISALLVVVTQLKFKESKRLKMTGLSLLQGIWSFYFGVFLYEQIIGNGNMEWILTSGLVITLFYLAWRGDSGC